jgi:hypothetical protein
LYDCVTIPLAVWKEVVEHGEGRAGAVEVAEAHKAGWIDIIVLADESLARSLARDLGDGESEVIALAIERRANLILLDESEARRAAEIYSLPKTGVIGVLIRAKKVGLIASLRVELDKLREGFWIEDRLYYRALVAVGEELR